MMKNHYKSFTMADKNLFYTCSVAYLAAVSFGLVIGYTSPALPDMLKNGVVSESEGAWFASILNIGCLAGCFVAGWTMEKFGRKLSLLLLTLPLALGWLTIFSAATVPLLYFGRFLCGVGGGMVIVVAPVYIAEISSKERRGMLGSGVQLGITIGILLAYVMGMYCGWRTLALLSSFVAVAQAIPNLRIHDTPRYLLMSGRKQEALQSLAWLRGPVADIDEECRDMEENLPDKNDVFTMAEFTQPQLLAPLKVSTGLVCFQQLTGINAVMFFTVSIFESAGYQNGQLATVIVGLVQVIFTLLACSLMDKAGRRLLLVVAGVCMTLSCLLLGYYYQALSNKQADGLSWLALTCVVSYIIGFSLGWGPIPMLVMSEVFPVKARGAASAVSMACSWTVSFILTNQFTALQANFGAHGVFWLFAAFCCLGTLFVYRMVPETKGKSLEDIELYFLGRSLRY